MKRNKFSVEFVRLLDYEKERNRRCPIIVEGEKDVRALREVGFEGEILKINIGKSLETISQEISMKYKEVIIFLDFDNRGKFLVFKIKNILTAYGTKCHLELWNAARNLPISSVEQLPSYLKSLEYDAP